MIHLTDEQFDRLLLEQPKLNHNDRKALGLILEVLCTGCPWQDAPEEEFGVGWRVCWERYKRWNSEGWFEALLESYLAGLNAGEADLWMQDHRRAVQARARKLGNQKRSQTLVW